MKIRGEKGGKNDKDKAIIIDPTLKIEICFTNSTLLHPSPSSKCSVHTLLVL